MSLHHHTLGMAGRLRSLFIAIALQSICIPVASAQDNLCSLETSMRKAMDSLVIAHTIRGLSHINLSRSVIDGRGVGRMIPSAYRDDGDRTWSDAIPDSIHIWQLAYAVKSIQGADTVNWTHGWTSILVLAENRSDTASKWSYVVVSDVTSFSPRVYWAIVGSEAITWLDSIPTPENLNEFLLNQTTMESSIVATPHVMRDIVQDSTEAYLSFDSVYVCREDLMNFVGGVPTELEDW